MQELAQAAAVESGLPTLTQLQPLRALTRQAPLLALSSATLALPQEPAALAPQTAATLAPQMAATLAPQMAATLVPQTAAAHCSELTAPPATPPRASQT